MATKTDMFLSKQSTGDAANNAITPNEALQIGMFVMRFLDTRGIFRNCVNCNFFAKMDTANGKKETCMLSRDANKQPMRPPAEVIVKGCDQHSDLDEIPF